MNDRSFVDFVSDQLRGLADFRAKAMFGGFGLYSGAVFFGIVYRGRLFFKTSEQTRKRYLRSGRKPFTPRPGQKLKNYYEVPIDVIEDDSELLVWAEEAVRL